MLALVAYSLFCWFQVADMGPAIYARGGVSEISRPHPAPRYGLPSQLRSTEIRVQRDDLGSLTFVGAYKFPSSESTVCVVLSRGRISGFVYFLDAYAGPCPE